ncbi:Cytochrome P450 2K1 [Merluccius polli]|uniref:Cytochrome P450 2K1 n=1 Tax=Merluccius polli TaxID=89951 RepID=A0AA47N0Y6_MERPO|nr:Cytochrome P450 2K1 [Merluccius polli]
MELLEDLHSSTSVTLLGAVLFLLVLFFFSSQSTNQERRKEPPGPRPLPLIGNLLQMDLMKPYITLWEFSKKYGNIFTVYLGPKKVVVLAGYKTVKHALVNNAEEFGEREVFQLANETSQGHGILFSNGESWKEMRRFALTTLRDFGMGKKISEEKIIEECKNLMEVFDQYEGKPFDTTQSINYAVSNIICSIVYGNRFEYDDPEFKTMVNRANETIRLVGSPSVQIYNMFPWLGKWFGSRVVMKNILQSKAQIRKLIGCLQDTFTPQVCRGFVDAFLLRRQTQEESGNINTYYNSENLLVSVANLFNAGTDTTATTLRWGLLLMAKYPQIQGQLQEELNRVIGRRQVRGEDRKHLPYTDAVIHEVQRLANIVPMSLPHATSQDITFQGYFIKKGTVVYPLLTSVLWDETEWESPLSFNPSHFLDKDGKFVKRDAFMPFSAGRRACVGESLARMELFLFFTTLLQCYRFAPPPGMTEDEMDLTPTLGLTLNPSPHKLCAHSRV